MNPINVLMSTGAIKKTITIDMTFHNPAGESNMFVQFGYGPLTIFNESQGNFSGTMNADPINMIHTSQKSAKEGLHKDLEGDFRSCTLIPQRIIFDE